MGTPKSPLDRYRIRDASETSWSNAGWMKSANWISATGSRPCRAMPMATPTIEDSARGVSMTRCSPNSWRKSAVTRKTPPRAPTSSPMTRTRSSPFISSHRVSWRVWTMFFSATSALLGEDVPKRRLRIGVRRLPRLVDGPVDLRLELLPEGLHAVVVGEAHLLQVAAEHHQGILLAGLLDLLPGPVGPVVVVRRVRVEAVGLALDQRGPVTGPGAVHGVLHRLVAGQHVAAVHLHTGEAVGRPPVGHVGDGHLLRQGN